MGSLWATVFVAFFPCSSHLRLLGIVLHYAQDSSPSGEPIATLDESSAVWSSEPPNSPQLPDIVTEPTTETRLCIRSFRLRCGLHRCDQSWTRRSQGCLYRKERHARWHMFERRLH